MQTFTDLFRYRFILSNLVSKNLKTLYRNMALGFFWSVLNPLVLVVVLTIVWVVFFRATIDFALSVLVTLIPYNLFVYCFSGCTTSIRDNASLVKKVAFPRQILPVSVVLTHVVQFPIQFSLVVLGLLILPSEPHFLSINLLWLPVVFGLEVGLCLGAGLLVSALYAKYRDVRYIVESILVVLFWICPIVYEASSRLASMPRWVWAVYFSNPLAGILEGYRAILVHGRAPDPKQLGLAALVTLAIGVVGVRTFWVHEREFADLI